MASMEVEETPQQILARLYPHVDEKELPFRRQWSSKDRHSYIGLSQNNLKVHYKGKLTYEEDTIE